MSTPPPAEPFDDPVTGATASLLASPVRRAVVDELAALEGEERVVGMTAAELGSGLGLHPTTIRFHVDQLLEAGVLEAYSAREGGVGRPSKRYVLREVPLGVSAAEAAPAAQQPFALLAGVLASALSVDEVGPLTPQQAGARWARRRAADHLPGGEDESPEAKVGEVIELLSEWGYVPETEVGRDGAVEITLRDCPFGELARTHPDVVCGLHRGLLRGALDAVGEQAARVSLQPFVRPGRCIARLHLDRAPAGDDRAPAGDDRG